MNVINDISKYEIVLMSNGFGWIELQNEEFTAGYIYFEDNGADRIGNKSLRGGKPPYVVMHQPLSALPALLHLLDNQKNLQVSLDDEFAGGAFLMSANASRLSADAEDPRLIRT